MKTCLHEAMLQAWLDGELSHERHAEVAAHLAGCSACAERAREARQTLVLVDAAWQAELPEFVPTDRLRARIEEGRNAQLAPVTIFGMRPAFARWQFAAAIAVLVIVVIGAFATRLRQAAPASPQNEARTPEPDATIQPASSPSLPETKAVVATNPPRPTVRSATRSVRHAGWLEPETSKHLGQTQMLLRSVRNADLETHSGLDFERDLARELLSRNRLLRRRAALKNDTRTEKLLSAIEPLLLDIANLPGEPEPDEMYSLKELIRDQQIIAELQLYVGKSGF